MNGFLLYYKEKGITSFQAIKEVAHILNVEKVGHCGTLDPFAEGLLIILLGKATKVSQFLVSEDKKYLATLKLGLLTDTLDITGQIIKEEPFLDVTVEKIKTVFNSFKGEIYQTPPMYSALKVKGQKLYELARKNIEIELEKRKVTIFDLELISFKNDLITFSVHCSKGTYIRSLARDIAEQLKTVGILSELKRISIGKYETENAYTLKDLKDNNYLIRKTIEALDNYQKVVLNKKEEIDIKNGKVFVFDSSEEKLLLVNEKEELLAIYQKETDGYHCLRGLF
ncbi:MAG: tRNA pseudouridine(55) synthase TruB [Bacillales bacterium]|jgi:tRNA pseudouridine55 synthase|nr:tRNA pseudouridine(55) synthase TruB [Bacillales bacterium]